MKKKKKSRTCIEIAHIQKKKKLHRKKTNKLTNQQKVGAKKRLNKNVQALILEEAELWHQAALSRLRNSSSCPGQSTVAQSGHCWATGTSHPGTCLQYSLPGPTPHLLNHNFWEWVLQICISIGSRDDSDVCSDSRATGNRQPCHNHHLTQAQRTSRTSLSSGEGVTIHPEPEGARPASEH